MKTALPDQEVKNRLEGVKRYNDYFAVEKDEKGQSLAHHIVGPRQLWRIMTEEWGIVDPTKFGVEKPAELPNNPHAKAEKPENLSHGI